MRHDSLKTQIKIAQATTHIQRSEANKFRAKSKALYKAAEAEQDQTKKIRLNNKGWDFRCQTINLRTEANSDRNARRHMHLAAAMLNGRTYKQCEAKCDPHKKPPAKALATWIAPYLPAAERAHAEYIADSWLKDGTLRLTRIQDDGIVQLLALDKHKANIAATKTSILIAEQALTKLQGEAAQRERWIIDSQNQLVDYRAKIAKATETLTGLNSQLAGQEATLRAEQDALKASKAITRSIDDLFEVA